MPFQSEKQRRFLHANHPEIAKRWERDYANGGYAVQGGVKNYLGNQKMVKAPKYWKSAPDHPETELTYITEPEKELLVKADLHGSLNGNVNRGPQGIASLNGGEIYDVKSSSSSTNTGGGGDNREKYIATQYNKPKKKYTPPPGEKGGPGYVPPPKKKKVVKTKDKEPIILPPVLKKKKKTDWVDKTLETADLADKFYKFGTTLNPLQLYKTNPYIFGAGVLKGLYDKKKKKKSDASEISTTLNFEDPWRNEDLVFNETTGNFEDKLTGEIVKQSLPGATQAKTFNTMEDLMNIKGATKEKLIGSKHKLTSEGKNLGDFIESSKKLQSSQNPITGGGTIENIKSWMTDDKRQNIYKDYLNESGTDFNETIKDAVDKGLFEKKEDFTEQVDILDVKEGGIANHFKRKKFDTGSEPVIGDALFRGNWEDYSNEQLQMMFPDWDPEIESIDEHIKNKQSMNVDFAAVTEGNGILDLTEGEETTDVAEADTGEVIPSLVPSLDQEITLVANGGTIGGGIIHGEPRGDRTGFRNPHEETATAGGKPGYSGSTSSGGGNNYQDRIQTIAKQQDNQPSSVYSNPNEDRAREEKAAAQKKALETQELMRSRGQYVDPILSMVGKKVVTDPNTGERITVDDQAVLMPEKKLVDNKFAKTRKAKWVSWEEKARWDRIDKVAEEIRESKSYKLEKQIGQGMVDMAIAAVGIPGLGIVLSLLGLKPKVIPKRNIAGEVMEEQVTGADLGWFQDTDWAGVDPEFEKDWDHLWDPGPKEDDDGDGPTVPLPPTIQLLEDEMYASRDGMSAWDIIKANQARRAMLIDKGIIQDNPIVDESVTGITMQANKGGLANLFRVKNQ